MFQASCYTFKSAGSRGVGVTADAPREAKRAWIGARANPCRGEPAQCNVSTMNSSTLNIFNEFRSSANKTDNKFWISVPKQNLYDSNNFFDTLFYANNPFWNRDFAQFLIAHTCRKCPQTLVPELPEIVPLAYFQISVAILEYFHFIFAKTANNGPKAYSLR